MWAQDPASAENHAQEQGAFGKRRPKRETGEIIEVKVGRAEDEAEEEEGRSLRSKQDEEGNDAASAACE